MTKHPLSQQESLNQRLEFLQQKFGIKAQLQIEYDEPTVLPARYSLIVPQTTQTRTLVRIQSRSPDLAATYYIDPNEPASAEPIGEIPARDSEPDLLHGNWNGAALIVANVSGGDAVIEVTVISQKG